MLFLSSHGETQGGKVVLLVAQSNVLQGKEVMPDVVMESRVVGVVEVMVCLKFLGWLACLCWVLKFVFCGVCWSCR